ncbi:MAG: alcohol dehydrogenase catalytic domain-containing protein [Oscillospiraceae bacterium]|nr:alcohol dehydrogenase catalytic domain-containing protein [Oscillospiraceae bacterium]
MISKVYRLVAPKQIIVDYADHSLVVDSGESDVLVRPRMMSICAADQRYFQGQRPPEQLRKKLPMALIHECCGEVAYDPAGEFSSGQKVLLVPNTPRRGDYQSPAATPETIRENYRESAKFRASGFDGFMQEYVAMRRDCLIPYSGVGDSLAAMTELISVAMHAVHTFMARANENRERVAVFGDGNLGYIVALLLRELLPGCELHIFGIDAEKLSYFSFAHTHIVGTDFGGLRVDHAFECVGGAASGQVINSIIDDLIMPEGVVMLMGVSETPVPIDTRMALERGLTLIGRSRSTAKDFVRTRDLLERSPHLRDKLRMIIREVIPVRTTADMCRAFEKDFASPFKTVMEWHG